jgi:hypothetical protein
VQADISGEEQSMATTNATPTFADAGALFNETTHLPEGGLPQMHLGILTVTTAAPASSAATAQTATAGAALDTGAAHNQAAQVHHHVFGHMRLI